MRPLLQNLPLFRFQTLSLAFLLPAWYLPILNPAVTAFAAPKNNRKNPTSTSMSNNDDFDDDFLAGFDVDAVVNQRDPKRLKSSPFPVNSRISIGGDKVNPQQELAPNAVTPKISKGHQVNPMQELNPAFPSASISPDTVTISISMNSSNKASGSSSTGSLEDTLQHYFGFTQFRPGQLQVLEAVLNKRDAAVFWATGSGKSLCYQIPPLHLDQVAVVVSPLISLMQDQVSKLNGLTEGAPIATYLGSSQLDMNEERKALEGDYRLVYVTPEKLLSDGFLSRLQQMHLYRKQLCLLAIDESHCVSEWGHDFRPEFRRLGEVRDVLPEVPIMALTATAVPRVQRDIVTNLNLRDPTIAQQSFDRPNLQITIAKKQSGGYRSAFSTEFVKKLSETSSTIVYVPTRDQVEEVASYLQQKLGTAKLVQPYHAGLSHDARSTAHTNFLVGKTHIIVATVAFGMGIDKPDTRRVVHYGPPKTVEEYYQQIGRAGRDGLPAQCTMFVADTDFDKYKSDFYTGKLNADAKSAVFRSIDALKRFALDTEKCRRRALLDFFEEQTPAFGERCGTCDTCLRVAQYGSDTVRDLGALGARIVLQAVDAMNEQSLSVIEKVIGGNKVEDYRYRRGCNPNTVQNSIQLGRSEMGSSRKYPIAHFRELLAPLVTKGYIEQGHKQATINGYSRSWTTYGLTALGYEALRNKNTPIMLPVPESMRETERKEEERRQRILKTLDDAGVDLSTVPKEEIDSGEGEVIRAFSKWHGYLAQLQKNGKDERHLALTDLLGRIETWRLEAASKYRMAPSAVLAEHTMVSVAYTVATMRPGMKLERDALVAAGVRTRELDTLVQLLNKWVDQVQPGSTDYVQSSVAGDKEMIFPDSGNFQPEKPWEHAVYKPNKKTGLATWESSYQRFLSGEHPQTIAMTPSNGRPIQVDTVMGHILDGLVLGRPVPVGRVAQILTPPTKHEWE